MKYENRQGEKIQMNKKLFHKEKIYIEKKIQILHNEIYNLRKKSNIYNLKIKTYTSIPKFIQCLK